MDILLFKDYYMFRIRFNCFENSNQSAGKMNEISIVIRRYCQMGVFKYMKTQYY